MSHSQQRRSLFIDRPVQMALLLRALLYLTVSMMAKLLIVFFFAFVTSSQEDFIANGPKLWWHLQLSVLAGVVLIPIILLDLLKVSHRWVGPISRLRASIHALSRGEKVPEVRFRDRDYWQELAGDLNLVALELDRQRGALPEESTVHSSPPATLEAVRGPGSSPVSAAI